MYELIHDFALTRIIWFTIEAIAFKRNIIPDRMII